MKIRAFVVFALILCGIGAVVCWNQATARPADRQTPVSKAIQAQNTPLLIQALITKMKGQLEKNDDTFPELIREVEAYTAKTTDPAAVAVLHSMLAEMYQTYYNQNRWTIDRRTDLNGYIPQDIREWTANLFTNKIKEELTESLQPAALLQKTPVSEFKAILKTGKNSAQLRPTLYDFLAFRAVDIQPSDTFYQDLLAFRRTQANPKALLLDELDYLKYKYDQKNTPSARAAYGKALDSLMQKYASEDISTEIRIAQVQRLQQMPYFGEEGKSVNDSITALEYQIAKEGIARFPNYERIGVLKNDLARLTQPSLNAQMPRTVYPGKELTFHLQYRNTPHITLRLYQSLRNPIDALNNSNKNTLGKLVKEISYSLPTPAPYIELDTVLSIPVDKIGLYECVISSSGAPAAPGKFQIQTTFSVTRVATLHRTLPTGEKQVWVTDYETGKPLHDVTVTYYSQPRNQLTRLGSVRTDKDGLFLLPPNREIAAYRATIPGDTATLPTHVYPVGTYQAPEKSSIEVSLFTDRGIYRPGQTVFFKGIAYVKDSENPHVVTNKTYTVSFRDANRKEIANKTFKTNEFGSFNGEFTIPKQGLSGNFSLQTEGAYASIRVEEYKRPTFRIEIDPLTEEVSFGHPVTIQGKAETFSGVALQTGQVTWQINRRPFWWRGPVIDPFYYSTEQVAEGKAEVNDRGDFSFSFTPEKEAGYMAGPLYRSYEVVATLTDSKGETQEARYQFSVGETGILLSINMPDQMEKDSIDVQIAAYTVNRQKATVDGTFRILSLIDRKPLNEFETVKPEIGKQVASGNFTSGQCLPASIFKNLPSGRYRLQVEAVDKQGQTVKAEKDFVLYSRHDKRPPVFSPTWLVKEKVACLPGEEAVFVFGTSEKHTYILYEIFNNNQRVEQKLIEMSDENRTFHIPFKAEYGEGIIVSFTFVKEGHMYVTQVPIIRRQPDRQLSIRPETFRDHLLPGSKENWTFRVLDADSTAVSAEVLASMFDASLDQILPFRWSFRPVYYPNLQAPRFTEGNGFSKDWAYQSGKIDWIKVPDYQYDYLNWQGILDRRYGYAAGSVMLRGATMKNAPAVAEVLHVEEHSAELAQDASLSESSVNRTEGVADSMEEGETTTTSQTPVPVRENFAETAFFYPALVTNAEGNVSFGFTIPESNTTWKLQLLAQTKDLKYGYQSEEVVTSKPLMVLPNLPRFMRQGDEVTISTQVINQSDKVADGRVTLELFDPANDQPVVCLTKAQKPFSLPADSMTSVSWTLPVPDHVGLIGCRIVADSDQGSDGEQHWIPILPSEILITESTPFFLLDAGEKQVQLPAEGQAHPFRLTLELSANPVWYAVQALPTLTQPDNDNILAWFAAYYSNTLASYLVKAHPRIRNVITQWTAQGGDASTLYSNLEKNEELKTILLEETPWVLAAENETEQKQRLALLFDLNRAESQRATALQQLLKQQTAEGGWSWFKGFPASRAITRSILKGMAQLVELNAIEYGQQEKEMQIKALRFLDQEIADDYKNLKTTDKKWQEAVPSPAQIDFLFMRSAYRDIPEAGEAREAIRFYTTQAEKSWEKQSLYGKGETALLMKRNGKKQTAGQIIAWLRKTATVSPELGMYWANNRRGTDFFTSPLDVHTLLMAAFHEIAPSTKDTDLMKQWLLNQKRTQNWESGPATVNAIYALLLTGSDWLNSRNVCTVEWDGQSFSTAQGDAALGYIKKVLQPEKLTPQNERLTIRKEGNTPAWGAVYTQYFAPISQVTQQKGALNVEKKLFIENNNGQNLQITPVQPNQSLRIGDKVIVRLTVRTDREMDYVVLKDLRAGCFEPANQLSGIEFRDNVAFYRSPTDVSENFFFNRLPQGTYVLEYAVYVSRAGQYASGISTIQCMYAPEFVSHTEGGVLKVE